MSFYLIYVSCMIFFFGGNKNIGVTRAESLLIKYGIPSAYLATYLQATYLPVKDD